MCISWSSWWVARIELMMGGASVRYLSRFSGTSFWKPKAKTFPKYLYDSWMSTGWTKTKQNEMLSTCTTPNHRLLWMDGFPSARKCAYFSLAELSHRIRRLTATIARCLHWVGTENKKRTTNENRWKHEMKFEGKKRTIWQKKCLLRSKCSRTQFKHTYTTNRHDIYDTKLAHKKPIHENLFINFCSFVLFFFGGDKNVFPFSTQKKIPSNSKYVYFLQIFVAYLREWIYSFPQKV